MTKTNQIQLFQDKKVRTVWDSEKEEWYFSVVDVVEVLTESENSRRYLSDLKRKLKREGSEVYENIVQLKLPATDGKMRMTDVATTEQMFRIIQSIPSPKAEPFKNFKSLHKESLRDNMTNVELALNMLAEASTTEISKERNPQTMSQHIKVAESGGNVAKVARKELETKLNRSVISQSKASDYLLKSKDKPKLK